MTDLGFDITKIRGLKDEDLKNAEDVLDKILEGIRSEKSLEDIKKLSKSFYEYIPHLPTIQ